MMFAIYVYVLIEIHISSKKLYIISVCAGPAGVMGVLVCSRCAKRVQIIKTTTVRMVV